LLGCFARLSGRGRRARGFSLAARARGREGGPAPIQTEIFAELKSSNSEASWIEVFRRLVPPPPPLPLL